MVGINDELSGQAVNAFVSLKGNPESSDQVKKDLIQQVRKSIGPFAAPKAIFIIDDLPKTRSGKIMRRILRKILSGEEDQLGDTSTVSSRRPPLVCTLLLTANYSLPIRASSTRSSKLCKNPGRNEKVGESAEVWIGYVQRYVVQNVTLEKWSVNDGLHEPVKTLYVKVRCMSSLGV